LGGHLVFDRLLSFFFSGVSRSSPDFFTEFCFVIEYIIYLNHNFKTLLKMKKVLFIVAISGLALVSCKKDYTCECTSTGGGVSTTVSANTGKMKKSDAETKCKEGNKEYDLLGEKYTVACKIK
jgi:hypothetical protein